MTIRKRWYKLRNYQSDDFWAMVFARPMTILFLLPIIEIKWITPNLLTMLSFITKLIGIVIISTSSNYINLLVAAALINIGLVFDNMDGTIARYRNSGSDWGDYFDKITDAVTFVLLFWAMGFRGYQETGNLINLVIPLTGVTGAFIANYAKWISVHIKNRNSLKKHLEQGSLQKYAEAQTTHNSSSTPPKRTYKAWFLWFFQALLSIFKCNEVDIYFWSALALITQKYWLFSYICSGGMTLGLIIGPLFFAKEMYKLRNRGSKET